MIKFETYANGKTKFACNGTRADVFADTMVLIKLVYDAIKENSKAAADIYKDTIITALSDPECPIYEEDVWCEK